MVKLVIHYHHERTKMLDEVETQQSDWLKLVDAAAFLGVYPGTLYRRWRYRQLPEGACKKVDNVLYFNRQLLDCTRRS